MACTCQLNTGKLAGTLFLHSLLQTCRLAWFLPAQVPDRSKQDLGCSHAPQDVQELQASQGAVVWECSARALRRGPDAIQTDVQHAGRPCRVRRVLWVWPLPHGWLWCSKMVKHRHSSQPAVGLRPD